MIPPQVMAAGVQALGAAVAGGPSAAHSGVIGDTRNWLDGSGWTVSTGSARAQGGTIAPASSAPALAGSLLGGIDMTTALLGILAAFVLVRVLKR